MLFPCLKSPICQLDVGYFHGKIPEFVAFVLRRLHQRGHEAVLVGGAVRDALLGRSHEDWDVATTATVPQIRDLFSDIRHFHLKHQTVTLMGTTHRVEVTTYRDGAVHGLVGDLSKRDFTINAMAYDPINGQIIDPFGGQHDIHHKVIRAVGSPQARFNEDPLRLLRAVRLATELGFNVEPQTFFIIQEMAGSIKSVARERVRDEMVKILMVPRPSPGFHLLRRTGLLGMIIPELLEGYLKRQNRSHRYTIFRHILVTVDTVAPTLPLRLTALLHDVAKPRVRTRTSKGWRFIGHEKASADMGANILRRLRFSSKLIGKVTHLIAHHMIHYSPQWSNSALRRWIRKIGPENLELLIEFRRADLLAHGRAEVGLKSLDQLRQRIGTLLEEEKLVLSPRDLAVDGEVVMQVLNISPGPKVGETLNRLLTIVTDHPELNTPDKLVDILKETSKSSK